MAWSQFRWRLKSSAAFRYCSARRARPGEAGDRSRRTLPNKSRAHLPDARVVRAGYHPEQPAGEVAVRVAELGVVEDVEEFAQKVDCHGFGNRKSFGNTNIGVHESGAV